MELCQTESEQGKVGQLQGSLEALIRLNQCSPTSRRAPALSLFLHICFYSAFFLNMHKGNEGSSHTQGILMWLFIISSIYMKMLKQWVTELHQTFLEPSSVGLCHRLKMWNQSVFRKSRESYSYNANSIVYRPILGLIWYVFGASLVDQTVKNLPAT